MDNPFKDNPNVIVPNNIIISGLISKLRDKNTGQKEFYEGVRQIGYALAVYAGEHIPSKTNVVESPMGEASDLVPAIWPALAYVMRAAQPMMEGFRQLFPYSQIWPFDISRDEKTLKPLYRGAKMPEPNKLKSNRAFILDTMLATGGTEVCAGLKIKKNYGNNFKIDFFAEYAAPEGIQKIIDNFPDSRICVAVIDKKLNNIGYIVPGCGDAGDREFGTDNY